MHYIYDLDGFKLAEAATDIYDGQNVGDDHDKSLEAAGWRRCFIHDRDPDRITTVYHQENDPDRGLYVDIQDIYYSVYTCIVAPRAWPQYYRTELLPILQAREMADIGYNLERLLGLITATSPGQDKDQTK